MTGFQLSLSLFTTWLALSLSIFKTEKTHFLKMSCGNDAASSLFPSFKESIFEKWRKDKDQREVPYSLNMEHKRLYRSVLEMTHFLHSFQAPYCWIFLNSSVWLMGLLGVVGNGFVIASRLIFREKNRIHSFYIKNLALADFLMGIFLLSIAFHDVKFRGEFLAHQNSWRHSPICKISGKFI